MKLGFIGMGNMATALCRGFIASNGIKGEDILAFAPNREKLERHANEIGFKCATSSVEVTDGSDVIIMACKPYQIDDVLSEVKDHLKGKALVSVAAGWNYDKYMEYVDSDVRVQFVMPNTPAMVGEGVLLFEDKNSLNDSEREEIMKLFSSTGIVVEMPSKLMGIGGAIFLSLSSSRVVRWKVFFIYSYASSIPSICVMILAGTVLKERCIAY